MVLRYLWALLAVCWGLGWPCPAGAHEEGPLRMVVVGDTGTGERAYRPGFQAVQRAMRATGAEVLLHLGDFGYQPRPFPRTCPREYIEEIRQTLVAPYAVRVFVAGDNDLPPHPGKPLASGCWPQIAPLATPFDTLPPDQPQPRELEGVIHLGEVMLAVIHTFPWADPTPWLKPLAERARQQGHWVIFALHEPPITTAWYEPDNRPRLEVLLALKPDLILAGNQHSYERFSRPGRKNPPGEIKSRYAREEGPVIIVTGGGGATFKPFADLAGRSDHSAPEDIRAALEKRALMNHFLLLKVDAHRLKGTVYRVCAGPGTGGNPRWRPGKPVWKTLRLECEGEPAGVDVFDEFEIHQP